MKRYQQQQQQQHKTTSSVISITPNKLYNILGSTKSGFKYLLNKKDLDIQFGNHSTKEIIDYFVKFCKNESDLNKCGTDFNNYFDPDRVFL
jgi:hypothetical protein